MLDYIHGFARRLLFIRPLLIALILGGALGAAIGLLGLVGEDGDAIAMPGLILLLWGVTGLIFIDVFAHLPRWEAADGDLLQRYFSTFWRVLRWLLVAGFLGLSLTVADLSLYMGVRACAPVAG